MVYVKIDGNRQIVVGIMDDQKVKANFTDLLNPLDPKDIEIHMEKGVLSIRGERSSESKTEDGKFTRVERTHGSFYRRFALPDTADAEQISASGKHGVLEIVIPKKAESTPRRIAING